MIRRKIQKYLLVIISMTFLVSCQQDTASKQGVLSWNQIPLEQTEDTMKLLETNSINRLYQYVSSKTQVEAWESLFTTAKEKSISVYALAGDSAWSLDVDASHIKQKIDMIYQLDQKISTGSFQGIMFDVEPYLLEEWDSGKYEVMESYTHVMKVAYTYAKRYGYEVILCIPYFLDEDFEEELDMLIPYCDEFVVMNYRKTKEWEQIETEVALSKKYDKPITILYELRRKIRLRNYGAGSETAKLEMKQKQGANQKKRSLTLNKADAQALINGQTSVLLKDGSPFALECYTMMNMHVYRPVTIVEYQRKAFIAKENNIRITFDHHITASESNMSLFDDHLQQYQAIDPYIVVLEVKFNGFLLGYLKDMINEIDRSETSLSKYCLGRTVAKHFVY